MKSRLLKFGMGILMLASTFSFTLANDDVAIVRAYYKAFNKKDYNKLELLIANGLEIFEAGNKVLDNRDAFISAIKWGKVFNSINTLKSVREENGKVIVEEEQNSLKIEFLYGQPIQVKSTYTVVNKRITKIEIELIDFDQTRMRQKTDEFTNWVKANHPDQLEAMNKTSKQGALTFIKAMNLFKKQHK